MQFFAHSTPKELLSDHLREVSRQAAQFAEPFGGESLAEVAGLWHDLGKYSNQFQEYMLGSGTADDDADDGDIQRDVVRRVDHSTFGAQHAAAAFPGIAGRLLAYCIAGHHAGLGDWSDGSDTGSSLEARLKKQKPEFTSARANVPPVALLATATVLPEWLAVLMRELGSGDVVKQREAAFACAFFCRMLFSCLIDADRTATERHCDRDKAALRAHNAAPSAESLAAALRQFLSAKSTASSEVNRKRGEVLNACRERAADPPGFFSLSVPTGGGKTFSSLAFALEHAAAHGLRRVIYAAPFTSIIEQNADAYRQALGECGPGAVLEHHSALESDKETPRSRLLTENWDAPIIVTTNVQLFESLFASNTSTCRKLHNIARSVIILDEAQALPVTLLKPCLAALTRLVLDYGCTIVLCTATQPAIVHRDGFSIGLKDVREIVPDVPGLFASMKRVRVEQAGPLSDEALIDSIVAQPQSLSIVNTRPHAAELHRLLTERSPHDSYHLSASMCAEHRAVVIGVIKARLKYGLPCRVISTQVVEAGVDIDFPVVFRAMAGLDSIAQAAGRCNREGKLDRLGRVVVFETDRRPPHEVRLAAQKTAEIIPDHLEDPLDPEAIKAFFENYYWSRQDEADKHGVMDCLNKMDRHGLRARFREASNKFKMIDDFQVPIIVSYSPKAAALIARISGPGELPHDARNLSRQLQRFIVNVPERVRFDMELGGAVRCYHERFWVLENPSAYDGRINGLGLRPEVVLIDPARIIV